MLIMNYSKTSKNYIAVGFTTVFVLLSTNFSSALPIGSDKISKCVESLKLPDTKRIYNNTVGEKLQAQLEEIEAELKTEKEAGKIKHLESKKNDVLDQIDQKLAKKCKSFTFLDE